MQRLVIAGVVVLLAAATAAAQVRVHPTGVNVNAQGGTTVFLTFGGLDGYVPVDAVWCGTLVPAAPDVGLRCDPSTIYGSLPIRFDRSRFSGQNGFTDVMSIPPSVARRAYQTAEAGLRSSFFYVRRFVRPAGGPDQYVAVTCRLAGGGARVPLALTDVELRFDVDTPVLFVPEGDRVAPIEAHIRYNGTGRLRGRWEVVHPGEDPPSFEDLLTEASLPVERRATQRRYTEIARFNEFLPPTGRVTLKGPDPSRWPVAGAGTYLVLLRIEASADREGDSNLASAGAGAGVVHSGGVAGFPMPVLRYIVGTAASEAAAAVSPAELALVDPPDGARASGQASVTFVWRDGPAGALVRLEIQTMSGTPVLSALVQRGTGRYQAPSWLHERSGGEPVRWRVVAVGASGQPVRVSEWRTLHLEGVPPGS
jgi:hypothetical protein